MPLAWPELLQIATAEVQETQRRLPAELQRSAREVALIYERRPDAALLRDGMEPDTLGYFAGRAFEEEFSGAALPPQIVLFLENLWELAEGNPAIYREETRRTYLHELGHYLGLDENDLTERDLD